MKNLFKPAAAVAAFAPVLAFAEGETSAISTITSTVESAMSGGATIATAVVVGLFAIFGIKLLWRAK